MSDSRLLDNLEWLVAIPSVTGQEQEIADRLEARLRASVPDYRLTRWRHGLLAVPRQAEPRRLMVGHLDTVPPSPQQTRRRIEGRFYGCGSSDMKAGVAVMLALLESHPEVPVAYLFYDQEEGPLANNGLTPLLDRLDRPGLPAIVLEPTHNEVQVGCVGSFHLRVDFAGVRCHAARPWQGRNALYETLPLLHYLSQRRPDEVVVEGQTFRQVITPTLMGTHQLANAVPGEAWLQLNIRFAPGVEPEALITEVRQQAGPQATLTLLDVAPAGQVCHTHPSLAPWIARRGLQVTPKQAWTDVAQLTARGYPAVNFGPGEPSQAHQPDEWTPEAALEVAFEHLWDLYQQSPASA